MYPNKPRFWKFDFAFLKKDQDVKCVWYKSKFLGTIYILLKQNFGIFLPLSPLLWTVYIFGLI